jgi:hypothetical protein
MNRKMRWILGITLVIFLLLLAYVLPIITTFWTDLKAYETQVAYRDDYKLHTTPLPATTIADLCAKLGINASNEHCESKAVVYAPDLFDEIQTYFRNLPQENRTYALVEDRLGAYLDGCEKPNLDGHYRCIYDLRGDEAYPIFFYFDRDGYYYRIIANTGGS